MGAEPARQTIPYSQFAQLREAREIIEQEADGLIQVARRLGTSFCEAVDRLAACDGRVVVTGVGKAGRIAEKLVATMSSTGTRAQFLHPTDAVHGDIGCLDPRDLVLVLSNSGESDEINRLIPIARDLSIPLLAITANDTSTLGTQADVVIAIGRLPEAGLGRLAPTTSTTAMLAVGDALALVAGRIRGFGPRDFARVHPAGNLGRRLAAAGEVMRTTPELRVAEEGETIREVFVRLGRPGRRSGAVILVDSDGRLSGVFTDSDLVRILEQRLDDCLDRPIAEMMTRDPFAIHVDALLVEAVALLSEHKLSELPVIDTEQRPVGLIDITDVIGLLPCDAAG